MYLGLDLRGGVHFMLQVDMQAAMTKRAESFAATSALPAARKERAPCRHQPRWPGHRGQAPAIRTLEAAAA
jgi:hypothetical protein